MTTVPLRDLECRSRSTLKHIPGSDGLPLFGETFAFLRSPRDWVNNGHRRYGPVFRFNTFFEPGLSVAGADFAERFFLDKERLFSSTYGWRNALGDFFRNGLMLRDFDDHKVQRRIMQVAFKREALDAYLTLLNPLQERAVKALGRGGALLGYPWLKQLTLEGAAAVFLGLELGNDSRRVNSLFVDVMGGVPAALRWNLPFSPFAKATAGKNALRRFFASLIPARRARPGTDMLSILCNAISEQGERFSDDDVLDHIMFLLMAAHDTTTSALTNMLMELGRRPELQAQLRAEARTIGPLDKSSLPKLSGIYNAFREVLRLYPPVGSIVRRTLRDCKIHGFTVPANTQVWVTPDLIHRDPALWQRPDSFDHTRFIEPRAEHKKQRFAFIPFGGGAHTCLGLQFSELQVKSLMRALLCAFEWRIAEDGARDMQFVPFVKPRDDLPLVLTPCCRWEGERDELAPF